MSGGDVARNGPHYSLDHGFPGPLILDLDDGIAADAFMLRACRTHARRFQNCRRIF